MKELIISILITMMIVFIVFFTCYIFSDTDSVEAYSEDRFVKIQDWGSNFTFYDNTTKVQYYYANGGMTVLVDADGKPLLYEED